LDKSLLARISSVTFARLALAFLVLAAAGCVVETGVGVSASGVVVTGPPPPPVIETRPAPPRESSPRAVWIAGYWHWTGMQYAWIPGHWVEARPGEVWRAPRYSLRDGVYVYEPGGWAVPPPPPPPR
jgi:hypothetical protein